MSKLLKSLIGFFAALPVIVIGILLSTFIGLVILVVFVIIDNYNYCTIPFERECWNPDKVYFDDPIRDEEILTMAAHMESVRMKLFTEENIGDFEPYYTNIPIYDSKKIEEMDAVVFYPNGKRKDKENNGTGDSRSSNPSDTSGGTSNENLYKVTDMPEDNESLRNKIKSVLGKNVKKSGRSNIFREKLDHYVGVVVEAGKQNGIDPRFLTAIIVHETGYGTSASVHERKNTGGITTCKENPEYGILGCSNGFTIFDSIDNSIKYQANLLKKNYVDEGLVTVPQIGSKYAPIGAANDPTNLNYHWVPNIGLILKSLGVSGNIGNGIVGIGSGYASAPDLDKYPSMKVRRIEFTEVDGRTVYRNLAVKELTERQKTKLKEFLGDRIDWGEVLKMIQQPEDAFISEAELHLRSLIQLDMLGTQDLDRLSYETAHALLRISRELDKYSPFKNVESIDVHKKDFVRWAKEMGYASDVSYKNDDELIKKLLLSDYPLEMNLLQNAAEDEITYPFVVYYLKKIPDPKKFTADEAKYQLRQLMKDKDLNEQTLSVLAIGHYMKRNAFEVFKQEYNDDLGILSFGKESAVDAFSKYIEQEKKKAEQMENGEDIKKKLDEAKRTSNRFKSFFSNLGSDLKNFIVAPGKWIQGSYFDLKVKGNTMIRFGIYSDTGELMEVGSFVRSMCFFTEPYAEEDIDTLGEALAAFGKSIKDAIGNLLPGNTKDTEYIPMDVDDLCARVNNVAMDGAKLSWEQSQVLDKTKEDFNIAFYCQRKPEEEIQKLREYYEQLEKEKGGGNDGGGGDDGGSDEGSGDDGGDKGGGDKGGGDDGGSHSPPPPGPGPRPPRPIEANVSNFSPVVAAKEYPGEFKGPVKVPSPYQIAGPKVEYFDELKDVEKAKSVSQNKAEKIYKAIDKAYKDVGLPTVGIKNKRGITIGKIEKMGNQYYVEWIDFDDNSKKQLTINAPSDCSQYKDPDYGFQTHDPAYSFDSWKDAYYKTPWEAYAQAKDFNLYFANMKFKSQQDKDELFVQESLQNFFTMTNVDVSLDTEWKNAFAKWLTGGTLFGILPPDGVGYVDRVLDPKEYEGIEFQLPVVPDKNGKVTVTSGFGKRVLGGTYDFHEGIDFVSPEDDILAAADGVVVASGWENPSNPKQGYGIRVRLKHKATNGNVLYTTYGHLKSAAVSVGDTVRRGQVIGQMGSTGSSTGRHLHFDVGINGYARDNRVNPAPILGLNKSNTVCSPSAENCPVK